MARFDKFYPVLLFMVFCLSLFLKHPVSSQIEDPPVAWQKQIEAQNLTFLKKLRPVNRGNFDIYFFKSENCDAILAVLPLSKNEEGAVILAQYLKKPVHEIAFIFKSERYDTFPAFLHWFHSLIPSKAPAPVFAVSEFGFCNLINQIDWRRI